MGVQIFGLVEVEKPFWSELTNDGDSTAMKEGKVILIQTALTSDAIHLIIMTSCRERPLILMGLC